MKNNNLINLALRLYIALARDEQYTVSELGDTRFGEPTLQLNWTENEKFREEVCAAWNLTDEQFFEKMIIPKPTPLENMFFSAELRRVFGVSQLRLLPQFDKDGDYVLPRGNGYFLKPKLEGNLINELEFVSYRELKILN